MAAFVAHACTIFAANRFVAGSNTINATHMLGLESDSFGRASTVSILPLAVGAWSGLLSAAAVFPFDFVRQGIAPSQSTTTRFLSTCSTVPYATSFFGVYFLMRDPGRLQSQCGWAVAASSCAVLAEIPFDTTKRALFGGNVKALVGVNMLYAPFASMMLVMYDKALLKRLRPDHE